MGVPHPIPYQGSKRSLAGAILGLFPSQVQRLVEPFSGSAAISLAAAYHEKARTFLLNDINTALMGLWERIINSPKVVAGEYRRLWLEQNGREKQFFNLIRDRFNKDPRPEYFLYLLARCVKATVRYNSSGQFNNSPDNRRRGAHPDTMEDHILRASKLLRGRVKIESRDYRENSHSICQTDLVYLDPPYQGVCGERNPRYIGGVVYEDFVLYLGDLNARGIPFLVSYDGRTGDKKYGDPLPSELGLAHLEVHAGRSTQATLLGREAITYESLYLSRNLVELLGRRLPKGFLRGSRKINRQMALFG